MPSAKQTMVLPVDRCTKLDLSNRDLKTNDLKTLNITRFNLLEQLDLSNNTLDSFPEEMKLNSLRALNFSENRFRCVKFLKQFPNLEEVSAEMNLININDEYMAVHMLPKLQLFNGHSTNHLRNTISQYETKLSERLKKIWKEKYNEKFVRVSSLLESNRIEKSLRRELQVVSCGPASLQHFKDYLIAHIVKEHMSKATQQKLNKNCPDDTDRAAGEPPKKRQKLDKVNGIKEKQKASKKLKLKGDGLKYDYSPVHFLRCHSKNNDQVDANTKVWRCLFEPNPEHPDESSDTVATCGGEAICLIDCKSGKVMKKYKQPNEDFYAIAWTSVHIEIGGKKQPANLLAAGGKNGELRLIYPSQLRCYSSTSHRGPINALLFHPLNASQLFSGTHEVIILWDIGIPKLPNYECHPRQLCKFEAVSSVLNLIVLPNLGS
ncbi:leucine-rich repeat and WD repeat-containing protein 1-like [Ptychodera flava]|uniref:leucine-rich repeat and WD repeat-containing protein 1-like n=1 Tax=Ptychodera flava TaxID=63121 RepID=UPI00396A1EC4